MYDNAKTKSTDGRNQRQSAHKKTSNTKNKYIDTDSDAQISVNDSNSIMDEDYDGMHSDVISESKLGLGDDDDQFNFPINDLENESEFIIVKAGESMANRSNYG